jgi:non-specific serine/threonine protein kinase
LAWSEDLLESQEKRLFSRLAVFVGGFTLEAAEAVCAMPKGAEPLRLDVLEGMEALVDQSLVWQRREADGAAARLGMHQITREYALERLEASGEAEVLRRMHAAYYLRLAEAAAPQLWRADQLEWLARLEREYDNLRAALGWARERGVLELGMRLAVALWRFWSVRGQYREGRSWLEGLLTRTPPAAEQPGSGVPAGLRAISLAMAGILAFLQEDYGPAATQLEAGLTLARQADDKLAAVFALVGLGDLTRLQGDLERAAAQYQEALVIAPELGDARGMSSAHALQGLGAIASARGDWAQAAARFEEALALCREQGDRSFVAYCLRSLGRMALRQRDLEQAAVRLREALGLFRAVGDQVHVAKTLEELAMTATASGQAELAARLLGAEAALREAIGIPILPAERADIDAGAAPARAALGEEAWAAAFAVGQALTPEEA